MPRTFTEYRRSRKLTQEQVEADVGISQAAISKGERFGFGKDLARKLARAYRLPLSMLERGSE